MKKIARPLLAGNWKMNGFSSSLSDVHHIAQAVTDGDHTPEVLLCLPATLLASASSLSADMRLTIGAQDCSQYDAGPFTGEVSAKMIADCGATHVIVGHSERRIRHNETDQIVRQKATQAIDAGLRAIICVGETEAERQQGQTLDIIARQLEGSLPDGENVCNFDIAYEPVWAIGTGLSASPEDISSVHGFLRKRLSELLPAVGVTTRLLYGGSVSPKNAEEILRIENVDGALVGGASLKPSDFLAILHGFPHSAHA